MKSTHLNKIYFKKNNSNGNYVWWCVRDSIPNPVALRNFDIFIEPEKFDPDLIFQRIIDNMEFKIKDYENQEF